MAAARAEAGSHLQLLGADAWHAKGLYGQGVTIAVLDSGFRGYREHLGRALPKHIRARSFRGDGNLEAKDSQHGILCAEIVHAIAPAAELLFANWEPDFPDSYLKAVQWCREQGATIFTSSIVVPAWSDGHGGGDVHGELAKILEGTLFFASAGNLAHRHWSGRFHDNGCRLHQWRSGCTENVICPWGNQPVSVEVTGSFTSKYRLSVSDDRGDPAGEERTFTSGGVPGSAVRFLPQAGRAYHARLEIVDGPGSDLRLIVLGGELEITTDNACMVFPGDGKQIIAVGAVSISGTRLPTSSVGNNGPWKKPECNAPVPFPSRIRFQAFGGTSAAAPQAAALAALLWQRSPQAGADAIAQQLRDAPRDLSGPIRLPEP